jgi:hypothetical protein
MSAKGKTFVLGIGAPKAGTTWAYAYLAAMPGARMGFTKEYHIWDALDVPNCHRYRFGLDRPILDHGYLLRREMQRHPAAYYAYFANLLAKDGALFTADWTPAYMALGPERLRSIQAGFAANGITTKVVFLMRDPVDRCLSMVRMQRSRGLKVVPGMEIEAPLSRSMAQYVRSDDARTRTRYDVTLSALALSGIPQRNIHIAFYEELFQPSALKALCDFLEVPFRPELTSQKVNAAKGVKEPLDESVAAETARIYRAAYEAAEKINPRVRQLWSGFRYLDQSPGAAAATPALSAGAETAPAPSFSKV